MVPPADIHDHVAARFRDGQARSDGRHHRLLDQIDLAGLRAQRRFLHRPLFHLGDLRGDADDDPRAQQVIAAVGLLDEVLQHHLGDVEVGDHAVLHRLDRDDVGRRPAEHLLGFVPDREDLLVVPVKRDNGRLVDHDSAPFGVDQGVRGAEIDGQITGEETE